MERDRCEKRGNRPFEVWTRQEEYNHFISPRTFQRAGVSFSLTGAHFIIHCSCVLLGLLLDLVVNVTIHLFSLVSRCSGRHFDLGFYFYCCDSCDYASGKRWRGFSCDTDVVVSVLSDINLAGFWYFLARLSHIATKFLLLFWSDTRDILWRIPLLELCRLLSFSSLEKYCRWRRRTSCESRLLSVRLYAQIELYLLSLAFQMKLTRLARSSSTSTMKCKEQPLHLKVIYIYLTPWVQV